MSRWERMMDQPSRPQSRPHRVFTPRGMGAAARRHAADARPTDDLARLQQPQRPDLARRGRDDLSAAVAPAQPLCRGDAGALRRDAHLSRRRATARRPSSSASPARSRSASRPRRACCARCSRRWPNTPKVDLITTDGFLYPNAVLEREGLMERKGFPESYDLPALLAFLSDIKAGRAQRRGAGLFAPRLRHRARRDASRSTGRTS